MLSKFRREGLALTADKEPSITTSFLRPGSKFHGTQRSDRQVYDVQVEIKDVDLAESFLCGYLRIQGWSLRAGYCQTMLTVPYRSNRR